MTVESGAIDSRAMFLSMTSLPELITSAQHEARSFPLQLAHRAVEHIVVVAGGVGALIGEALVALCRSATSVPVVVSSQDLPAFVSPSTLVFVPSLSEEDEETFRCADAALKKGAQIVVIGNGDRARSFARGADHPVLVVPDVSEVSRSSSAVLVVCMLVVLERLGLFAEVDRAIDAAHIQLGRRRDALTSLSDVARPIADHLDRTFPLVYGVEGIGSVAAMFWKASVNLNAKSPAFWGAQPLASSIEAVGFGQAGDVTRQLVTVVQLHTDYESQSVRVRAEVAAELIRETVASVIDVRAEGSGALAQLFDLLFIGEIVSLLLAARSGIDPGPTPILDDIDQAVANETTMPVER